MNNKLWDIINRNMISGIHTTEGESRPRDVNNFLYWLRTHNLFWEDAWLLNVGVGDCQEATIFQDAGLKVVGISNSQDEVQNAIDKGIYACAMDAHQLTFPNEEFRYVYLHDTMEHFVSAMLAFLQFRRVLNSGGILAFHYPAKSDIINWTHWFIVSPDLMFSWLLKFGFKLLHFSYEPGASSEFFYIAEKVEISDELYKKGANVIKDMLRELNQLMEKENGR